MRIPTISEKTSIPQPPEGYLARRRLDDLWRSWERRRVVLVTAEAGSGKTSFLAANARVSRHPPAWLTLDEQDTDLTTFLNHLRAALSAEGEPHGGDEARRSAIDPNDPSFARQRLAELIHLLRAQPCRFLILDDVHQVRDAPPVQRFLADLIRYVPEGTTLILSGREPIDVPTLRGRMQGRIAALSARDLSFGPGEVIALFEHRFPGGSLHPQFARRLVEQTEGWATGLEIFFQLLDGTTPEAVQRTLDRLGSTGTGWFDYFAEEIVAHLDGGLQDFLERICVLPRLDGNTCDRLLGARDSGQRLEILVRRNLFTVAVDESAETFRMHALFRTFLQSRLRRRLAPPRLRAHLRRASRLLVERGAFAEAAEVLAESGDVGATITLIERRGESLLADGRYETVRRIFIRLPESVLLGRPRALFVRARMHDYQSEWDEAERLYRRILRLRPGPARRAELISLIAQIISRRGRYAAAYAWCGRALAGPSRIDRRTRGRILATMGVCASELGRLEEGERLLRRARELYRHYEDASGEARIDYLLAINIYLPRGELTRARTTARRALLRFRRLQDPRRICYSLGVLALVSAEAGDHREGRELAEETLRIAENIGQREHQGIAHLVLGRCAQASGDPDAACRHFDTAVEIGEELGHRLLGILPRIGLAEIRLGRGDLAGGREVALAARSQARTAGDRIQEAQCWTVLGQICAADEDPKGARRWWRRAEAVLRGSGTLFDLRRVQLLRLDGERLPESKARSILEEILHDDGRIDRDVLFCRIEPDRAARVLPRAIASGIATGRAADLLASLGDRSILPLTSLLDGPDERARTLAVEILTRIGTAPARRVLVKLARRHPASPLGLRAAAEVARTPARPLHLEALGRFRVRLGDEEIPAARWRSGRALRLFQLLVLHRFRWVPKEQVIDTLWADADPEKAAINLWQSVHRLRQILEPDLEELRDSRYIRFQNDAYRLEPGDGGFYDVSEFELAVREGERMASRGKAAAAEKSLRRALELYSGDFLAEHPYEDFAAGEREKLRDDLIRGLLLLIESLASRRRWIDCIPLCRQGLERDPYHESFHSHLVHSQFMLRHRREALESYHGYEEIMIRELGLPPSQRMKALAERISAI